MSSNLPTTLRPVRAQSAYDAAVPTGLKLHLQSRRERLSGMTATRWATLQPRKWSLLMRLPRRRRPDAAAPV